MNMSNIMPKKKAKVVILAETPIGDPRRGVTFFTDLKWKMLKRILYSNGILEEETHWMALMDVPGGEFKKHFDVNNNRKVPVKVSDTLNEAIEIAKREIKDIEPNIILAVGDGALFATTGLSGVHLLRGSVLASVPELQPLKVIAIPDLQSAVFSNNSDDDVKGLSGVALKLSTFMDIARLKREKETPLIERRERKLDFFAHHDELDIKGKVGYDIETFNNHIICTGFATSEDEGYCSPLVRFGTNCHVGPQDELRFWRDHAKLLENPDIKKIIHNAAFEHLVLWRNYGIDIKGFEDSMLAHFTLWRDLPKGLHFCTSTLTDIPFYKDEGEQAIKLAAIFGEDTDYWDYNSKDCVACLEIWNKLEKELLDKDLWNTYVAARDMIPILTYMHERGMRVDQEGINRNGEEVKKTIKELQDKLEDLTWKGFNVGSPKDMANFFWHPWIDAPKIKGRKAKNAGFGDDTLRAYLLLTPAKIKGKYKEERIKLIKEVTELCREVRKLRKSSESFLSMKFDEDGRFRSMFNPMVKTQRLSSRHSIDGTGGNQQNLPKSFRKFVWADKGYLMFAPDLSQAEARIVAYGGPVPEVIKEIESGKDLHKLCAAMVFEKAYEDVSDKPGEGEAANIGTGDKSERHWGKTFRHAFNYGLGPVNFAKAQDITQADGMRLHRMYHSAYPNVVNKFHKRMFEQLRVDRTITNLLGFKRIFRGMDIDMNLAALAANHYAQSSVGSIINERGLKFLWDEPDMDDVDILNQIHDQILFQIPVDAGAEYMLHVMRRLCASLELPLKAPGGDFVIPTDMEIGGSFGTLSKFDFRADDAQDKLEEFLNEYKNTPSQQGL